jgi:hypothetical protein
LIYTLFWTIWTPLSLFLLVTGDEPISFAQASALIMGPPFLVFSLGEALYAGAFGGHLVSQGRALRAVGNLLFLPMSLGISVLLGYDIRGLTGALIGFGACVGLITVLYAVSSRRNKAHPTGPGTTNTQENGQVR